MPECHLEDLFIWKNCNPEEWFLAVAEWDHLQNQSCLIIGFQNILADSSLHGHTS